MDDKSGLGDFVHLLRQFVDRSGYNTCQIARLSGIPRRTIANWLEGAVQKPRTWQDVVKVAGALRLPQSELNQLLDATGFPLLARLKKQAQNETERVLLTPWLEEQGLPDKLVPFQAIPDLPTFVGRERTLQVLQEWLLTGYHDTACVLEGTIGVGKTALAARLAYRLRSQSPDGVLWARLDTSNVMSLLHLFAAAYGQDVTGYDDLESRSTAVRQLLADKQALLVLDNVQNSRQIQPLLPPSGSCAVLVTTRRRDLAPAHGAHRVHLEPFAEIESLALLAEILGEERVARERADLSEMVDVVGQLPLAVDILASRLAYEPNLTAADLLERLRHENGRLDSLIHEERCVRCAFAASYTLLTPDQQRFFAALGAFGGEDFSVEAAATVSGTPMAEAGATLSALFCLSLVRRGRPNRYRLIPLLRAFAREKIDDDGVWHRLVDYFVAYIERHEMDLKVLDVEKNNVLAALTVAQERELPDASKRGLKALAYFSERRGMSRFIPQLFTKSSR